VKKLFFLSQVFLLSTILFSQTSTPPSNFATSDGSSGDPYFITILNNLYWLSQNSAEWDKHYIQTNNINASSTATWEDGDGGDPEGFTPIGNIGTAFTGSYDGQGFTVDNLTIDRDDDRDYVGLFGLTNGAIIKKIGVTNVDIKGMNYTGALVGYNTTSALVSYGYSTGLVNGLEYVGGLVGSNPNSSIVSKSYSTAAVSGWRYVGGLIGVNGGTISNCYSLGDVTRIASDKTYFGAFCGFNSSIIEYCYTIGSVIYDGATDPTDKGFVGLIVGGTTHNSNFWDSDASNQTSATGATGKTTTEMKTLATYTDLTTVGLTTPWDFKYTPNDDVGIGDYWDMSSSVNNGYPFFTVASNSEINIKQSTTDIPDGGSYSYNCQPSGSNTDIVFTIENTGTTNLTIDIPLSITGTDADQFSIPSQPSSPVSASSNTTFTVRYSPTSEGSKTASISIGNNDSDENPYDLTLNGAVILGTQPLGSGTLGDPYQVSSLDNLLWISTDHCTSWDKHYIQTTNIDASNTTTWDYPLGGTIEGFSPIGTNSNKFTGSYNGQNYAISNLYINRGGTDYIGLFGSTGDAIISNLGLANINITGNSHVGGMAGKHNWNFSPISNCYSTGSVVGNNWYVGGLVGSITEGKVNDSYSTATVSGGAYVGGLAGTNGSSGYIENCYSTGAVSGGSFIGGLVSKNSQFSTITNSYSSSPVSGSDNYVGGLIGANYITVNNCYSTGTVTRSSGTNTSFGAFCGYFQDGSIKYCYTTGSVIYDGSTNPTDKGFVGDLIGTPIYSDNFWDSDVSNQTSSAGATGKTTTEMKSVATFTDETTVGLDQAWDFIDNPYDDDWNSDYWGIDMTEAKNNGYPYLSWQYPLVPEINLKQSTIDITDGGSYNYGNKKTGTNTDVIFTIENTGTADLTLTTPLIIAGTNADQFSIQSQPTSPVTASSSTTFTVRFSPTSKGAKTASIAIGNNDTDENPYNIILNGIGTAPTGAGTEEDPYLISVLDDLLWMSINSSSWDKYFKQTADIDASSTSTWDDGDGGDPEGFLPIGNDPTSFTGSYDGQNYTIDGLFINRPSTDNVGLFGVFDHGGIIENIGVTNINITGQWSVGGLVGFVETSNISNCYSTGLVSGGGYVGGLVGWCDEAGVRESFSSSEISGTANAVGGLIGYIVSSALVQNCYSLGNVIRISGTDTYYGAFCGMIVGATANYCYTKGSVYYSGEAPPTDKGFRGYGSTVDATGNFWDSEASNQDVGWNATAKNTTEMKTTSTFTSAGWDFIGETGNGTDDYWHIDDSKIRNSGYPYLTWQYPLAPEINLKQGATNIADGGAYNFGSKDPGTDTDIVFTIENLGTADLTLTTPLTISGTNADQFSLQSQPTSPVAPGNNTTFTVRFSPTSSGAKTASIAITNNDSDENPYNLTLNGTGAAPEINLKQGTTNIADGGSFNYGRKASGSNTDAIFTIENVGTADLTLTTPLTITGINADQFILHIQPSTPVAASSHTTFTVRFSPTSTGAKIASIAISNNDSDENPYDLILNGECANCINGSIIYNTVTNKFNFCEEGEWVEK